MAYDDKCYDLAVAFLADSPDMDTDDFRSRLAQVIQDAIDTFIGPAPLAPSESEGV